MSTDSKPDNSKQPSMMETDVGVDSEKLSGKLDADISSVALDAHYDPQAVARVLRKIDWRMLPLLGFVYSISLIDRTNLGVARISGMGKDLNINIGERYSIASMVYFPPYILLEIPGNIILRWLGARSWITICVVGWGAAQTGMAFVPSWGLLCLTRVLLGAFEAGFFPAMAFIITTWYKRHEVQKRLAIFYLTAISLTGFSSILAYALQLIGDRGGLRGWRWIFLLEGLMTIVLGLLTWFVNTFLSKEETKLVLDRIEADRRDSLPDPITLRKDMGHSRANTRTTPAGFMFMSSTMPAYTIAFFTSILLSGMGFGTRDSLLLGAPPYAISCYFFAWISDKTNRRAIWIFLQSLITITGLMVTGYGNLNGVRYFGLFLINMGASGCIPGILAYRSVSTALVVAFGGVGGIFSTLVFRQKDYPDYIPGIWATMACQFFMILLLAINTFVFQRRNKLAAQGKRVNEDTPGFYYTL
ncbi:major facilitator superfamily domain-containing protein [Ephemerocybe angulata]|uniref:Major facilitator superfamily domain-containing protein n=1 Tax=Ephemerocybe angulata TaxID=980116 RepID=A0A8H6I8I9_9AGAR|nr:major facilitator superfamily domain-containing protein [Tulosesus angulatus]